MNKNNSPVTIPCAMRITTKKIMQEPNDVAEDIDISAENIINWFLENF